MYQRGRGKNIRKTGGKSEESGHDLEEEKLWCKGGRVEIIGRD